MKKAILFTLMMILAFVLPHLTMAAPTAEEILKQAHLASYYAGNDGASQIAMMVYTKGSNKPIRKIFTMMKLDLEEGGKQKFFIFFSSPADIAKTTFLVHKYVDQDDYRRLYLPASDKVIPIAGSRKQDPFMGSDFSYEDVSGRHYTKDNHTLLGEETLTLKDGNDTLQVETWVTESVPKEKEEKIAKLKAWIDKKTHIPMQVEFTNHDGQVYKVYQSFNVQNIDGFPTIMKRVMTSPLEGTRSIIYVNPKATNYNLGIDESVFSDRSLRYPPMQYIK